MIQDADGRLSVQDVTRQCPSIEVCYYRLKPRAAPQRAMPLIEP